MANIPPLSLSDLVDITVAVGPTAASANTFNQGLIVGSSTVIPSVGANSRLLQFTGGQAGLTAMLSAGFTSDDPEYIAAQIFVSNGGQNWWIGVQDLTAIQSAIPHAGSAGAAYKVGDQVLVTQGGASLGFLTVLTIGVGGAVDTLGTTPGTQGTSYSIATALATTGGSGTGLEVDITAIGETLLQAVEACRMASTIWYGLMVCGPVDADNLAISEWADPLWQTTRYYPWSNDVAIANGTSGNLALQLQTLELRVLGIYSTTQNGLFPNNIFAAAAVMGVEMGLNTGLANSFFTVAHKQLVGIAPEPVTQTQYSNILAAKFNVYGNFSPFQLLEPGFMSNGSPSYLWINLAVLVANLQIGMINVLQANPAIDQTNADEHLFIQEANTVCQNSANIGFLADGTWQGTSFSIIGVSMTNGQPVPGGFSVQAQPYSQQSSGNRAAGQAMPLFIFITTAGAVQSLAIGVNVQL